MSVENFKMSALDNDSTYGSHPEIDANVRRNIISISGEGCGYYFEEYFEPFFIWLKAYINESHDNIIVNFKMEHLCYGYSRKFTTFINILENHKKDQASKIIINWYYEEGDEEYKKEGEDLSKVSNLEFNLIPYQENS